MSWFLTFAAGGVVGIVAMGLAQWVLGMFAKRPADPLPANARPCLIRVAGDTSFCQTCGAQWPVEDFAFCRRMHPSEFELTVPQHVFATFGASAGADGHKAWLDGLLARAAADEKAEVGRVLGHRGKAKP
jgi:hypothetical protein